MSDNKKTRTSFPAFLPAGRRLHAALMALSLIFYFSGYTFSQTYSRPALENFARSWLFNKTAASGQEQVLLDDRSWRAIDLPHDWSREDLLPAGDSTIGPFTKQSGGKFNTGYFLGGTAWYRKHFRHRPLTPGDRVAIEFDGVYRHSSVFINGHLLGMRPSGYSRFSYDLTPWLKGKGRENVLAVRVENLGDNSRWYTGSGIYRSVFLHYTHALDFAAAGGLYITTDRIGRGEAWIDFKASILNSSKFTRHARIKYEICDSDGHTVSLAESRMLVFKTGSRQDSLTLKVSRPSTWSPDHPARYLARVSLVDGNYIPASQTARFGIRKIEFSPSKGMLLNGEPIKLRGGCIHHDNGLVGSTALPEVEARRIRLLKASGFNAIRTSHNPVSTSFLDACDSLGMLVMEEAFDVWRVKKVDDDYSRDFLSWWDRDLESMIFRDRNHPCIFIWSIGNEIPEPEAAWGLKMAARLRDRVRQLDPQRPVTQAVFEFFEQPTANWKMTDRLWPLYLVQAYNYKCDRYEADKARHPERIFLGSETFPMEALKNENQARKHPWVIGDFVWTAMDYYGENGIGRVDVYGKNQKPPSDDLARWPWNNAWCGDIDQCGDKKPQSFYRDVVWDRSVLEMAVEPVHSRDSMYRVSKWGWPLEENHWSWPGLEGKSMKVRIYSRAQKVRLELNGKLLGIARPADSNLCAEFLLPYRSGTLSAFALDEKGFPVAGGTREFVTCGPAAAVQFSEEPYRDRKGKLRFIHVTVCDSKGRAVKGQEFDLQFQVKGAGRLLAAGNACPNQMQSFTNSRARTFKGRALVVVEVNQGEAELTGTSPGLQVAQTTWHNQ